MTKNRQFSTKGGRLGYLALLLMLLVSLVLLPASCGERLNRVDEKPQIAKEVPYEGPGADEDGLGQPQGETPNTTAPHPSASATEKKTPEPSLSTAGSEPLAPSEPTLADATAVTVPGAHLVPPNPYPVAEPGKHYVALTFDDGPNGDYTDYLLDHLKAANVKVAFFLVGNRLQYAGNHNTAVRAFKEGHLLCNHTWNHKDLASLTRAQVVKEVADTDKLIKDITGDVAPFLRPPYGSFTKETEEIVRKPFAMWSVDPQDWAQGATTQSIIDSIVRQLDAHKNSCRGDIVLLHDIHIPSIDAAVELLKILPARGYTFVRLDTLLYMMGQPLEPGKAYYQLP